MASFKDQPEPYGAYWNWEIVLYRGDKIIDQGTIKEVAERRGVQKRTIRFYLYPTAARRAERRQDNENNGFTAIRTDLEEDDE